MSPPSVDSGPLSDVFKAKITTVIQEQLKPIVAELAAQQETLLNHLALLKHNHNVNDYQMIRLENIRNLEQSINFKVTGALGFCPWQHPSMGTNLREPVPADPLKIPQFMPADHTTREERAATSSALIKEAGVSARRLGVPLTLQDFPRDPVNHKGEDVMHSSVPLFGLEAPRWRTAEGLPEHDAPGTASYDGVLAKPLGKRGKLAWEGCAKRKKVQRKPLCKLIEEGADPYGIGVPQPSSSSIRRAGSSLLEALDVPVRGLEHRGSSPAGAAGRASSSSAPPLTAGLSRSETMATIGSTAPTSPLPTPPPLRRSRAMAYIAPLPELADTPTETTLESAFFIAPGAVNVGSATTRRMKSSSSLSRASTMATIGSPPPPAPAPLSRPAKTAKIAKAKSVKSASKVIKSTSKAKAKTKTKTTRPAGSQRRKRASASTSTATATSAPSSATLLTSTSATTTPSSSASGVPTLTRSLKRARRTDDDEQHEQAQSEEEEKYNAEPPRKRLKRAVAPSPSPTISRLRGSDVKVEEEDCGGDGDEHTSSHWQGPLRRSSRVTRASTAAAAEAIVPVPAPARRGRATKGKKTNKN